MMGLELKILFKRYRLPLGVLVFIVVIGVVVGYWWMDERRRVKGLLVQGEALLAKREYGRALERLDKYLAERPGDGRARLLAVRAARQARDFRQAQDYLGQCAANHGDAEWIAVEEKLLAVAQGDDRPVPELRERSKEDDALALVILEVLVQRDLDTYQLGAALDGFTRYLDQKPDDLHALLGRGFVWERYLSFADAAENYRQAVAAHPDSERARLKLAETLLIVGTPQEALTHFVWLADRMPEVPPVRLGLARCQRRLGEPEKARQILDGLLVEFPNHGETLWERGELDLEQGKAGQAEPFLRKAAQARPFDRRVQYSMYRCLLQLGREEEAGKFDKRVKQLDSDLAQLAEIRKGVKTDPNNAALRAEGGLLFLRHGEREEGVRWLQLALKLDPNCETAQRALIAEASRAKN